MILAGPSVGGAVQLRLKSLCCTADELARLKNFLSGDELQRGNRLLDPQKRRLFFAGRGALREMLAEVVGGKPGNIALTVGPFGKPQLSHPEQEGIRFNLSHAGDKLLLALTAGCEVGVDLEKLNAQLPFSAMAERFFSERENLELSTLPLEEQLSAFYRCWTRKEAYLKGTGTGFSQPANGFDISLLPQQPPALLTHRGSPGETTRWSIRDLAMPTGYCAALAFSDDLSPLA